jgi:6-phosphogluconolactonase
LIGTMNSKRALFVSLLIIVCACCSRAADVHDQYLVYIGTYTGVKSKGIYVSTLNAKTGALTPPLLAAEVTSPSFLAIHPNNKVLYAANEVGRFQGKPSGAVTAYSIDSTSGKLTMLNQQPSGGGGPCHVATDAEGKVALVANYGGGSIASYPLRADGSLGETATFIQHKGSSVNARRQEAPHAHCIGVDPGNKFVFAADLGLDKVLIYQLDTQKGTLTENDPAFASVAPGAGPRHFAFTPDARYFYVINEMDLTLTAFSFNRSSGALKEIHSVSTVPGERDPKHSTAEIEVHPSGKFVYGSNRGHDSIAVFAIDDQTGKLTLVEHEPTKGKTPRNFGIDPTGAWLLAANQGSDSLWAFRIDSKTGRLTPTENSIEVGAPVCVKFVPAK